MPSALAGQGVVAGPLPSRKNIYPNIYPKNIYPKIYPNVGTTGNGNKAGSSNHKGKSNTYLSPRFPVTQINLRHKKGAWGTLLSNILIKKHPIILATEPYADTSNNLPKVHKDLIPYYYKKKVI